MQDIQVRCSLLQEHYQVRIFSQIYCNNMKSKKEITTESLDKRKKPRSAKCHTKKIKKNKNNIIQQTGAWDKQSRWG